MSFSTYAGEQLLKCLITGALQRMEPEHWIPESNFPFSWYSQPIKKPNGQQSDKEQCTRTRYNLGNKTMSLSGARAAEPKGGQQPYVALTVDAGCGFTRLLHLPG